MRDSHPTLNLVCLTHASGNRLHVARSHIIAFGPSVGHEDGVHTILMVTGLGEIGVRESVGAVVAALHPTSIAYGPLESPDEDEVDQDTIPVENVPEKG